MKFYQKDKNKLTEKRKKKIFKKRNGKELIDKEMNRKRKKWKKS